MSRTQQDHDPEILLAKNRLLEVEDERLHSRLIELTRELASLKGERVPEQLALELRNLEEQRDWHRRKMFGDSSEQRL